MNKDELWAEIDAHRRSTVDLLEDLTDEEWRHPSLCAGWTVRDVAAHLTLLQLTLWEALRMASRYRGGMNQIIQQAACDKAAMPVDRLIAEIHATIGSRRHNVGTTDRAPLIEILVHGQDIALPLGRDLAMSPQAACTAASRMWSDLGGRRAAVFRPVQWRGVRFVATDADWAVGEGLEVHGPVAAILLYFTGRGIALDRLSGDSVEQLRTGVPGA